MLCTASPTPVHKSERVSMSNLLKTCDDEDNASSPQLLGMHTPDIHEDKVPESQGWSVFSIYHNKTKPSTYMYQPVVFIEPYPS